MSIATNLSKIRSLTLDRPLVFLDLETTGLDPLADRIVEIALVKVFPNGSKEQFHSLVNPRVRIPSEATRVHGITNSKVREQPTFSQLSTRLFRILSNCDLAGFNISGFDILLLQQEFKRVKLVFSVDDRRVIDVQRIYHQKEPRDLSAAYRFYCGTEYTGAHSALRDAMASSDVLDAQLTKYADLPNTAEELAEFCRGQAQSRFLDSGRWFESRDGKAHFTRGMYRGRALAEVAKSDSSYLDWMLTAEIPRDTAKFVARARKK